MAPRPGPGAAALAGTLLEAGWLVLAALTPSLFNPASARVFEPEKVAFVRSLALLMAAVWAFAALSNWRLRSPRELVSSCRRFPLLLPAVALMAVYLAAALLSDLPQVSLLGSYRRQFGVETHVAYALVFLAGAAHLRSPAQARRLLLAIAVGSLIPSAYAVAQKFGVDPLPWAMDNSRRVVGTLGQPTFLGAYLAGALPSSLQLLLSSRSRLGRAALAFLLALQLAALVFSQSRAAWLGASLAGVLLLVSASRRRGLPAPINLRPFLAATAVVAMLLVAANLPGTEVNRLALSVPYLERIASLADFASGSGRVRTLIWQTVPSLVAERPLLGHGPEMMGYAFERHYPPELAYAESRTASADSPHDLLLEPLVSAGFLGLGAYLWLLGSALLLLARACFTPWPPGIGARSTDDGVRGIAVAALGGLAGLLVEGMVGVTSASAYLLFWLYLALVAWVARSRRAAEIVDRPTGAQGPLRPSLRTKRKGAGLLTEGKGLRGPVRVGMALALLGLAGLAIVRTNLLPLVADVAAARGSSLADQGRFPEAVAAYREAVATSPEAEYYLLLGQAATQSAERSSGVEAEATFRRAEEALQEAKVLDPLDLDVALAEGRLHQVEASLAGKGSEWALAEGAFRGALALSPRRSYVRNRYGALLAAQGRHQEALAEYRVSADLDPRYAATYGFLGDSLAALSRPGEAMDAYQEAERLDPKLILVRINLGELYLKMGSTREAVGEFEAAVALAPGDQTLRRRLADLQDLLR